MRTIYEHNAQTDLTGCMAINNEKLVLNFRGSKQQYVMTLSKDNVEQLKKVMSQYEERNTPKQS